MQPMRTGSMRPGIRAACIVGVAALAILLAGACGGDDDGDDRSPPATSNVTQSAAGGTPLPRGCTAPAATVQPAERTLAAEAGEADPNQPRCPVSTIPAPPDDRTPAVDSTAIADPAPDGNDPQFIVDMNAAEPGIQAEREVQLGDIFQVAVVFVGVPSFENNLGGLDSFNWTLLYDLEKVVAPTYSGGPATERNPRLNVAGLGGVEAAWGCLPTPEGDLDEIGGLDGNGDPRIAEAFLQCITFGVGTASGTVVLGTVEFHAVGRGKSEFVLVNAAVNDALSIAIGNCEDSGLEPVVPCSKGLVDVKE